MAEELTDRSMEQNKGYYNRHASTWLSDLRQKSNCCGTERGWSSINGPGSTDYPTKNASWLLLFIIHKKWIPDELRI